MKRTFTLIFFLVIGIRISYSQVNWADDVACIIYSHCTECHTATGIAPFNLESYQDAFTYRYAIQGAVADKSMPPWPPNQDFNAMAHANELTQDEIDLISAWVNAGAPEGNPMDAPEPPVFDNPEVITDPDYVVELPSYTVPASNDDLYKCFVIPTDLGEDKKITDIEIIPGNRNIVHHILMYQDISNQSVIEDQNDPDIGFTCFGDPGSQSAELMAGWVPGSRPVDLPPGMAIPLPDGANIIVQIHYPEGSEGETDQTKINLKFSDESGLRDILNFPILNHLTTINEPLFIQPNQVKSFHSQFQLPVSATGISVAPHAHLVCTSMRMEAELPNGNIVNLIDIPEWDFNWQGFYSLESPVILPQGTILHGYATYDNTSNNPNNPNNPPQPIYAGESTTDEMMVFYVSFMLYQPGDENLVLNPDGGEHWGHHEDCEPSSTVGLLELEEKVDVRFSPNPIHGQSTLFIDIDQPASTASYQVEFTDLVGRKVADFTCDSNCSITLPDSMGEGVYLFRILENGTPITNARKIVVLK